MLTALGNEGMLILDEEYHVEFANQRAHNIMGHASGELVGKKFLELVEHESELQILDNLKEATFKSPKR